MESGKQVWPWSAHRPAAVPPKEGKHGLTPFIVSMLDLLQSFQRRSRAFEIVGAKKQGNMEAVYHGGAN